MLDDTNVPFDWDHIFPQSFKNKGMPQYLTSWYDTNGNLWACPYSFNRCVHDEVPYKKFAKKGKKYLKSGFVQESLEEEGWDSIKDKKSFKENIPVVYKFILQRNLMLIREWYKSLLIEELTPYDNFDKLTDIKEKGSEALFDKYLNKKKWKDKHENEDFEDYKYCRQLKIDNELYLYIAYNERLVEKDIEFGLYAEKDNLLSDTKKEIEALIKTGDMVDGGKYIYTNFTLISDSNESYKRLFNEMIGWLKGLPSQNKAKEKFGTSLLQN